MPSNSDKSVVQTACCCRYCSKCRDNADRFKGGYYGLPEDYRTISRQIEQLKRSPLHQVAINGQPEFKE